MSLYTLLLFGHIVGALGFFCSIVMWLVLLVAMQSAAKVEEIRTLTSLLKRYDSLLVASSALLLAAGAVMTATSWGRSTSWILVSLIAVVLLALTSMGLVNPRMRTIATLAAELPDGAVPQALSVSIESPLLYAALMLRIAVAVSVVFLMVVKPSLGGSLAAVGAAWILGAIIAGFRLVSGQFSRGANH